MTNEISILNRVALGDVIRRSASKHPNKEAVVDGDKRYTYLNLYEHTNQLANYLLNEGYVKGERVATISFNSYEQIVAMYGIEKASLVWVPINIALLTSEIDYILKTAEVNLVIVEEALYEAHKELLKKYNCLLITEKNADNSFTKAIESGSKKEPNVHIEDRDIAHIMFTSGTTSNPKGVLTSHLAIHMAGLSLCIELELNSDFSLLAVMPFYHCAQHTFIHSTFILGGKLTVMKKFEPVEFMSLVEREQVNFTFLIPMLYKAFLYHPERQKFDLSSIKKCLYAMAPMDQSTLEKAIDELGVEFYLASGQTEMYPGTVFFKPQYQLIKKGSCWGEAGLVNDLAIMDDDGNILPQGQVGEIVHRGPNVMNGYLNNSEATEEAFKFDWHHTGDLGYKDEDGLLVFVDRKKDMIKTGGENVASIRIEQVLLNCELIENAVVVGLPHPKWVEAVTAFVIVKKDITEQQILDYCKQNLSSFQVPKKIVFVDEFPMTTTGKIQKHKLRSLNLELYENEGKLI